MVKTKLQDTLTGVPVSPVASETHEKFLTVPAIKDFLNFPLWGGYNVDPEAKKKPFSVKKIRAWLKSDRRDSPWGASAKKAGDWDDFVTAVNAFAPYLCFAAMVPNSPVPVTYVDLDDCVVDGVVDGWAIEIIRGLNSYTEYSRSGRGFHILCEGSVGGNVPCVDRMTCDLLGVECPPLPEIYTTGSGRAIFFTGDVFDGMDTLSDGSIYLHGLFHKSSKERDRILGEIRKARLAKRPKKQFYNGNRANNTYNRSGVENIKDLIIQNLDYQKMITYSLGEMGGGELKTDKEKGIERTEIRGRGGFYIIDDSPPRFRWWNEETGGDALNLVSHFYFGSACHVKGKKFFESGGMYELLQEAGRVSGVSIDSIFDTESIQVSSNGSKKDITQNKKPESIQVHSVPKIQPGQEIQEALDRYNNLNRFRTDSDSQCYAFMELYEGRFLYSPAWGWMNWTGTHWCKEMGLYEIGKAIRNMLRIRRIVAINANYDDLARACKADANVVGKIRTCLRDDLAVRTSKFDKHKYLINCKNGVIDLKSGKLFPHSPDYYFTYCLETEYKQNADYSPWLDWLSGAVGGDNEVISYIQKCLGYSITGDTSQEGFFYIHGPTRSGKGVFTESLLKVLGGLGVEVPIETFTAKRQPDSQNFDLAGLRTKRFVVASETAKGVAFSEKFMKAHTGGGVVRCAHKHKEFFEYKPEFKYWITSNFPPKGDVDDDAFWARIKVVSFPKSWLGNEDTSLKSRMKSKENQEGILKWLVEGAISYLSEKTENRRLETPDIITRNTKAQRDEQDKILRFLTDCGYKINPDCKVDIWMPELYLRFKEWCEDGGYKPMAKATLCTKLKKKGIFSDRKYWSCTHKKERYFNGLELIENTEENTESNQDSEGDIF
jgi:putative DNA primase/helicase